MYNFNFNVLDPYIVRPVAVARRDYVPQPARNGLSNFTGNLEEPAVMVNYFLQGRPLSGMVHFTRFFPNTIFGDGRFYWCCRDGEPETATDWNLTASVVRLVIMAWVMGLYVQLPFYGSFTLRDDGGDMADGLYPVLSRWPADVCG